MLMNWKDSGASTKSDAEVNHLVKNVLLDPNFKLEDLRGPNVAREYQQSNATEKKSPFFNSFQTADIDIKVPSGARGVLPGIFSVPGLLYQKLTAIIQAAFSLPLASHFHFSPFKLFHNPPNGEEERVFYELYNSDVFIEEHNNMQHAPLFPDKLDCKLEKVVAALMFWSDSTHLANFGTAKLWPIYLLFGNISKYICGQPNLGACQHVVYIPSLPDSFQDFAASFCSKWGTQKKDLMMHCR
jgi:Plavaka transposase